MISTAKHQLAWAWMLLAAIGLLGCEKTEKQVQKTAELSAEQKAIARYSDSLEGVDRHREAFVAAWERSIANEEVNTLTAAISSDVMPALTKYRDSLGSVPTDTPELEAIHGVAQDAFDSLHKKLETFSKTLREDNRQAPIEDLIAELGALAAREGEYQKQLESYYSKHDVALRGLSAAEEGNEAGAADGAPAEPTKTN